MEKAGFYPSFVQISFVSEVDVVAEAHVESDSEGSAEIVAALLVSGGVSVAISFGEEQRDGDCVRRRRVEWSEVAFVPFDDGRCGSVCVGWGAVCGECGEERKRSGRNRGLNHHTSIIAQPVDPVNSFRTDMCPA
jgi:hypothetical protein